jgi:transposase, IS5 family
MPISPRAAWMMRAGTLVDATLIAAPPSKNKEKKRDPEMHQTRKGNPWYFGMKAHLGADRDSKLVPTVVVTAANVADITKTAKLLHGQETQVHADAGYTGVEKRAEITVLDRTIDWQIARKSGQLKKLEAGPEKAMLKAAEKAKASVRAFVEHPFHIIKNIFRYRKVRSRGLAKNGPQLYLISVSLKVFHSVFNVQRSSVDVSPFHVRMIGCSLDVGGLNHVPGEFINQTRNRWYRSVDC